MATQKWTLSGIKKVMIGPGSTSATLVNMFELDNFAPGTFIRTKNVDTIERIVADGKSVAYVSFQVPGDPDRVAFSLLDQDPRVEALLSNVSYDAATSTVVDLAKRKLANIALEITTELQNGKYAVITIPNIDGNMGTSDPLTFNNVEKLTFTGDLKSFIHDGGIEAISIKKWYNAAGEQINGTAPTLTPMASGTATTNPKVLTATASAASPKTIASQYWTQISGPSTAVMATPNALSNSVSGLVTGVYVFRITVVDSAGFETSSDVTITATIA